MYKRVDFSLKAELISGESTIVSQLCNERDFVSFVSIVSILGARSFSSPELEEEGAVAALMVSFRVSAFRPHACLVTYLCNRN